MPPAGIYVPTGLEHALSGAPALSNLPRDHADSGIERGFYSQIAGIQQEGVVSWPHRRGFPARIALIAAPDIVQNRVQDDRLAAAELLAVASLGPDLLGGR